jgi:type I restriction enzyme M protein
MLDNITKNRINTARDILVGKVPDPKSQVEQITIALIYKFMDDMDLEAEELGGNTSFFVGEYEKYGWRKIFDPALGGHEMLGLYGDAITKMALNPNLPQLFRDIFKNAYLPYRDPETLKLFLKTINEFSYDHSEMLGDAFEYLLSILGSQGDAGQFRTPRHIIDFIVKLIDPKKTESICDPACGTAGFLISSYKHIVDQNTKNASGDLLTPDDRKRMMENFAGYDISPDMVRLSLVNMYLHGFTTPQIYEYDSLTDETRWNEYYDVFLANPPFMTPKGGIRPSKKFSIDAKKAEVLFTDYMAEHLTTAGRAGIIVPNGIVATTQTAYKQLRKLLVENSLIGVISLPAGVFQPYSGVKTSILILDKQLAKKTDSILFLKIDNDGFELGAQRREHDKNDLPEAIRIFENYKKAIVLEQNFNIENYSNITLVEKDIILANKEVVLNADRYLKNKIQLTEFEITTISKICTIVRGSSPRPQGDKRFYGGKIPRLMISDVTRDGMYTTPITDFLTEEGATKSRPMKKGDVIMAVSGNPGLTTILAIDACIHDGFVGFRELNDSILPVYLFYMLNNIKKENNDKADGAVFRNLTTDQIKDFEIPLPPIEIQKQIVDEINGYQKIINGAKQVVNNYKPTIAIKPEWEMVELGTIAKLIGGSTPSKDNSLYWVNGNIDWITCSDFSNNEMYLESSIRRITEKATIETSTKVIPEDTLIMITRVSLGKFAFTTKPTALNQDLTALLFDETKINKLYAYYFLISISDKIENDGHGATVKGVTRDYVKEIKIPLPTLQEQKVIVKRIQEEQSLVNSNKKLISLFEQKIKDKIDTVWGVKDQEYQVHDEELMMVAETKN